MIFEFRDGGVKYVLRPYVRMGLEWLHGQADRTASINGGRHLSGDPDRDDSSVANMSMQSVVCQENG